MGEGGFKITEKLVTSYLDDPKEKIHSPAAQSRTEYNLIKITWFLHTAFSFCRVRLNRDIKREIPDHPVWFHDQQFILHRCLSLVKRHSSKLNYGVSSLFLKNCKAISVKETWIQYFTQSYENLKSCRLRAEQFKLWSHHWK